jgi:hypothetical protein
MSSTEVDPIVLVTKLWEAIKSINARFTAMESKNGVGMMQDDADDLKDYKQTMIYTVHRLTWLELVVKGLSYQEQHDAAAYAKFVNGKHDIEGMEIDELRELLRER